jgi:hypothetical protein
MSKKGADATNPGTRIVVTGRTTSFFSVDVTPSSRRCHNRRHIMAMRIKDEVVGHRYLQTIRLRLKFELSIAPALVFFSFGLLWLNRLDHFWPWWPTFTVFALSTVVVLVYILYEAYRSADVLHEVREVLVRELPKQPSAPISARETGA